MPELSTSEAGKVLVRLKWAMICGSDMPSYSGKRDSLHYPCPVGVSVHECVGEVVQSTSSLFTPGDFVLAIPNNYQGLAEFYIAQDSRCVHLPAELQNSDTCPLIQPLSTVLYAVDKLGDVTGRSVAIVGLGPIGQLACWLLKQRGAKSIVGIDPSAGRCAFAQKLGATKTFAQPSLALLHSIRYSPTHWEMPDICIEAVGHQTQTINDCIALVRASGTVLALGVPHQDVYPIAYELLFRQNLHLITSVGPDWSTYLPIAADLFCQHQQELAPLVTHRFPILEAAQAYDLYEKQQDNALKIVLDASSW